MRVIRSIHDVATSLLAGGIAGAALCAMVLFEASPSREVAGRIGDAIFGRLGVAVLGLSLVSAATGAALHRLEAATLHRRLSLALSITIVAAASVNALWLTPRLHALWLDGEHAADGSGLTGPDRERFLALHGAGSLLYLLMLLLAILLIVMRGACSKPPQR